MDRFKTLEPVRLHGSNPITTSRFLSRAQQQPTKPLTSPLVGALPADLHVLILTHLPIPDFPAYTRSCRSTAAIAQDEKIWERRWKALAIDRPGFEAAIDALEAQSRGQVSASRAAAPPTIPVDDDFGDFSSVDVVTAQADEMGDFVGAFDNVAITPNKPTMFPPVHRKMTFASKYIRVHNLLKPLLRFLSSPAHIILSDLATYLSSSPREEAVILHLLSLFLSPAVQPVVQWRNMYSALRSAIDRFDANLLASFDISDGKADERGMREAAESSWEVWDGIGDWEMGKVWAEKREIFYQQGKWNPLDNFTADGNLDFEAMDTFMGEVLEAILEHGARAVRVFPPASQVLLSFAQRLATDVIGEYIESLLMRARELSSRTFLTATAATFREASRIIDPILQVSKERPDADVSRTKAEDVVYQMFEVNMDEYLDEEVETVKHAFEKTCRAWDQEAAQRGSSSEVSTERARFLGSHNPAQVKRNVLSSFTDLLLIPVTIVPRAVGGVLMTGGTAAVQGIAMLNPQRWGGNVAQRSSAVNGYSRHVAKDSQTLFEIGEDEDLDDDEKESKLSVPASTSSSVTNLEAASTAPSSIMSAKGLASPLSASTGVNGLDMLLSLDVALELVHSDREALKRVETFAGYPGHYGHRVRDTIEEIFILMLQALCDRHMSPGFSRAIEQMASYKPADHEDTTSVAPLLQFFELVHIGDTIQSMVQVYFDKELAPHIDKTDFLNGVVREKKRFENSLDDSVAGGLNAGTDVLMNQVDHIIQVFTKPREYYPPEDAPMDLGPTRGCTEAIKCLDMHCKLLKGSTSKEVLEVFHQEVGIRLIAILQKHIKRQIISLNGGFQVIADLNTYHAFILTLRVPAIASEFSHLKMLGHVYVVEDAIDLAQIVRDVTRYGGAYRPEDIYEFIQRRSDWKKIEKVVDKTMYNLSFKEDCVVC